MVSMGGILPSKWVGKHLMDPVEVRVGVTGPGEVRGTLQKSFSTSTPILSLFPHFCTWSPSLFSLLLPPLFLIALFSSPSFSKALWFELSCGLDPGLLNFLIFSDLGLPSSY